MVAYFVCEPCICGADLTHLSFLFISKLLTYLYSFCNFIFRYEDK